MLSSSRLALALVFALGAGASGQPSPLDLWVANEDAAASASKLAHFAEAEKLLLANEKLAANFPPKDARLPRTTLDLAQVFRAEGKYSEALPRYERALEIYSELYGPESTGGYPEWFGGTEERTTPASGSSGASRTSHGPVGETPRT
jgi:tetratricopeptide (TPR) repeat protein